MRLILSPALRLAVPSILGTASAFLTTVSAAEAAAGCSSADEAGDAFAFHDA